MKKTFLFLLLIVSVIFSCTKNEKDPTPSIKDEKDPTPNIEEAKTTAFIGNEAFNPTTSLAFISSDGKAFYSLTAGNKTIHFSSSSTSQGSYAIVTSGMRTMEGSKAFASLTVDTILYTAISGNIEITSMSNDIISGKFSFIAKSASGKILEVKDGIFTNLTFTQPSLTEILTNKTWTVTQYTFNVDGHTNNDERVMAGFTCKERQSIVSPDCGNSPEWCAVEKRWDSYRVRFLSNNTSKSTFSIEMKKTSMAFDSTTCATYTKSVTKEMLFEAKNANWNYKKDSNVLTWDLGTTAAELDNNINTSFDYQIEAFTSAKIILKGTKVIDGYTIRNSVVLE